MRVFLNLLCILAICAYVVAILAAIAAIAMPLVDIFSGVTPDGASALFLIGGVAVLIGALWIQRTYNPLGEDAWGEKWHQRRMRELHDKDRL